MLATPPASYERETGPGKLISMGPFVLVETRGIEPLTPALQTYGHSVGGVATAGHGDQTAVCGALSAGQ
jgi:hypothetical protein